MSTKDGSGDELFDINLQQLLVIAANVVKAKTMPDTAGYLDCETSFTTFLSRLQKYGTVIKKSELEAGLWACNILDEQGEFFNVTSAPLDVFINQLMQYKQRRKHFDRIYNQVKDRPRIGRPTKTKFDKIHKKGTSI